jgi:hypothetical protein
VPGVGEPVPRWSENPGFTDVGDPGARAGREQVTGRGGRQHGGGAGPQPAATVHQDGGAHGGHVDGVAAPQPGAARDQVRARLAQQPQIAAQGLGPRRRRGRFQFPAGHDTILPGPGTQNQDHRSAASLDHPVRKGAEPAGRPLTPWNIRHAALHSLAVARVRDPPFCMLSEA